MHLLAVLPLVCLFFCPANGLLATHTASQASPQSTAQQSSSSRPSSSSRSFMSNRTSLSNQQPSSSQSLSTSFVLTSNSQRSPSTQVSSLTTGNNTSWLADDTKLPSLRTGKDNSRFAANGNSSSPLNTTTSLRTGKDTTKLAAYGNSTSPLNTTLREDFTPRSLTYIVWTLDSEDEDGNEVIWNSFIGLGVDGSNINILGPPPGLSSVDGFELVLNTEQRKELKVEVSTR